MPTRSVLLQATLTTDGTALSGKTLSFYYRPSGTTTWTSIGTATTDINGNASVTTTLTVPATYDFRVEFSGDADYEPSYAEVDNYKVKAKTAITLTITPQ